MKKVLIALGVLLGLILLAGIAIVFLVDVNAYKPRIEAAVSDALGMEFRIQGKARLRLLPSASIVLSDIRLRNRGTDLATAETLRVGVKLRPLLSRRLEITAIVLEESGDPDREGDRRHVQLRDPAPLPEAAADGRGTTRFLPGRDGRRFREWQPRVPGQDRRRQDGGIRDRSLPEEPLPPGRPGHAAGEGDLPGRDDEGQGNQGQGLRRERRGGGRERLRRRLRHPTVHHETVRRQRRRGNPDRRVAADAGSSRSRTPWRGFAPRSRSRPSRSRKS